jgi:hypothetical protein
MQWILAGAWAGVLVMDESAARCKGWVKTRMPPKMCLLHYDRGSDVFRQPGSTKLRTYTLTPLSIEPHCPTRPPT